jgi:hypothetical protein
MPSQPPSGATLHATEGGDIFAGMGVGTAFGSIAATEGHDTFAGLGPITNGTISGTEGHDTAAIAGWCIVGTLAGSGRNDTAAGAGAFKASGAMGPTAGADTFAGAGRFAAAGSTAVTGGNDTAAASGKNTFHATGSLLAGGADAFAGLGFYGPPGVLGGHGRNDTLAGAGLGSSGATLGVTERPDVFRGSSGSGLEYHIYANSGTGDPIDYSSPIATTGLLTWTSSPLGFPGTWRFGVRAFNQYGEEENLDCALTLILDAGGNDISLMPVAPTALRAFATAGGGIRVEWAYNTISPKIVPTGFHVYIGTGGTPSYGSPVATVAFNTAINSTYVANLAGLMDGVTYTIGVRTYNAVTEEPNTNTVKCTADTTGPSAVVSLTATAIV